MEEPEEWKSLETLGFSKYDISNLGNVWSRPKERIINGYIKDGYPYIFLVPDGAKIGKNMSKARIIGIMFVPNPENKEYISYIDGDPKNTRANNLKWISCKENGIRNRKKVKKFARRPIYQLTEKKEIIRIWDSVNEAAEEYDIEVETLRTYINKGWIRGGFYWSYCDVFDGDDNNLQWKLVKIIGYKSVRVSNTGIVKSKYGRLRIPTLTQGGYLEIPLTPSKKCGLKSLRMGVHRLVAIGFIKERTDEQIYVNHKDGNKKNNHYSNLEWCTQQENIIHAIKTGLK